MVYGDATHAGSKSGFHRPGSATALAVLGEEPAAGGRNAEFFGGE